MGYTHYYTQKRSFTDSEWHNIRQAADIILRPAKDVIDQRKGSDQKLWIKRSDNVDIEVKCEQTFDLPTMVFRICHVSESHPSRKDDNVPRQCHTLVHEKDGMRKLEEYHYHYAECHHTNTT